MAMTLPVIILSGIFAGFGGLAGMIGLGKRELETRDAVFQLEAGDLRLKDIHRLHGLQVNMTGQAGGAATFCLGSTEHNAVECVNGTITHGPPHGGLHHGNLSFPVPGLEDHVRGQWISMLGSGEDVEVGKEGELFGELVRKVRGREEFVQEFADVMGWVKGV